VNKDKTVNHAHDAVAYAVYSYIIYEGETDSFEKIIFDDINKIESGDLENLNNDLEIYGNIWVSFQDDLKAVGCAYWAELYKDLFAGKFKPDKKELARRVNAPEEIKKQGAAAVGEFMLT
jgi:hypothetical protein